MLAIVLSLWLGATWLRRWIVPEFSGALARLADLTIAVALLIIALQLLGTLSHLTLGVVKVGCLLVPLVAPAVGRDFAPSSGDSIAVPRRPTWSHP